MKKYKRNNKTLKNWNKISVNLLMKSINKKIKIHLLVIMSLKNQIKKVKVVINLKREKQNKIMVIDKNKE